MSSRFEPSHEPVFEPPRRKMHASLPGIFPTKKAAAGYVRTCMPLMMDGLYHLDTNPDVVRILPYPLRIEYASSQDEPIFKMRDHTFHLCVEMRTGKRLYVDYVPFNMQLERPWVKDRTSALTKVAKAELGADYVVHDERSIHIQPRFANIRLLWTHMQADDDAALMVVRRAMQTVEYPTTIADVRRRVQLSGIKFETYDEGGNLVSQRNLDDVDRVFSAIMQMVTRGEINIDYSKPFNDNSLLFERL